MIVAWSHDCCPQEPLAIINLVDGVHMATSVEVDYLDWRSGLGRQPGRYYAICETRAAGYPARIPLAGLKCRRIQ